MDLIKYDDFAKVDFRVGQIIEIIKVENSEKLLRMRVDFGELGIKIVFSGIYSWYKPEELLNKKTVFVVNIEPKKIMNELSEAMIFAAGDGETTSILWLDKEVTNGTKVF
jgi:methionyl-tRNA synthetase